MAYGIDYTNDKKTGDWWQDHFEDKIMDGDGWRYEGMDFYKEEIDYPEYMKRLTECTVMFTKNLLVRMHQSRVIADYKLQYNTDRMHP